MAGTDLPSQTNPKWLGSWAQWIPRPESSNRHDSRSDDVMSKVWDWRLFFGRGIALERTKLPKCFASVKIWCFVCRLRQVARQNVSFCVPKLSKNSCVPKWCLELCSKVILLPDCWAVHSTHLPSVPVLRKSGRGARSSLSQLVIASLGGITFGEVFAHEGGW